jgi:hypothetical protein
MNRLRYNFSLLTIVILCTIPVMFVTCKKYVSFKDAILITGTETDKLAKFVVESTPSSYSVTATATDRVNQDITVHFEIDTNLVAAYNTEYSANYYTPPAGSYQISANTSVIGAGTNVSDPVTVSITSITGFIDGRPYLIPVTIKSVDGPLNVLEASRTIYLKVARVFKYNSIDISNYNFYRTITFANPTTNLNSFTFEVKCYISSWHTGSPPISRLCVWGPADGSKFNLLRFGEAGSAQNQLQWINSSGSVFSTTLFSLSRWYTLSCVYDGSQCRLYVDGVLDNEFDASGQTYSFSLLELGMSYSGYQNSQRFLGRTAEIRLWNRALSRTEIQNGLCGVYSGATGLVAYWKLNEGSGQIFNDCSGHGYNMTWPYAVVWNSSDDNKCAQ